MQSRKLADVTKLSKETTTRGARSGILNSSQSAVLTRELESMLKYTDHERDLSQKYTSTGIGPGSSSSAHQKE